MRYPVYHYQTPEGYSDFPFTYIFDGTNLPDGVNLSLVQKALQGDSDFLLRHVMGLQTVLDTPANGGKVQLYNASGTFMSDKPMLPPPTFPIVPEKLYQFKDVIRFDLYQTLRSFFNCSAPTPPIYTSFIGFRGVKRFVGNGFNVRTTYEYREVPQVYVFEMDLVWNHFVTNIVGPANLLEPPRRFVVPIQNWDFELDRILVSSAVPGQPAFQGPVTTDIMSVILYDSQNHATSDLPVPITMLSSAGGPPGPLSRYRAVFPTPPLVYPAGSQIKFDVVSNACNPFPNPGIFFFNFQGIWRIPCSAGNFPQGEVA